MNRWVSLNANHSLPVGLAMSAVFAPVCASADATPRADPEDYRACGVVAVYTGCRIAGIEDIDLADINQAADPDGDKVTSFVDLDRAARSVGMTTVAVDLDMSLLEYLPSPAIMQVLPPVSQPEGVDHFLVYLGRSESGAIATLDPPRPPYYWYGDAFATAWTGKTLVLFQSEEEASAFAEGIDDVAAPWRLRLHLCLFVLLSALCVCAWWPLVTRRTVRE